MACWSPSSSKAFNMKIFLKTWSSYFLDAFWPPIKMLCFRIEGPLGKKLFFSSETEISRQIIFWRCKWWLENIIRDLCNSVASTLWFPVVFARAHQEVSKEVKSLELRQYGRAPCLEVLLGNTHQEREQEHGWFHQVATKESYTILLKTASWTVHV